jgi:peptidoglycan/LPS O-acetylase OafA/YrhL
MQDYSKRILILRRIGAVLAGMAVGVVLSLGTDQVLHVLKVYPPWGESMSDPLFLLATAYRLVYGVIGSYVMARLAPDQPMKHALAGGVIGVVVSTLGAVATWNHQPPLGPHWYPVALIVTAMPCAWLGGKLRIRQLHQSGNS